MPQTIITKVDRDEILTTIKALCEGKEGEELEERQFLLVLGAVTALGKQAPPHWQIAVMCRRTDRLFEKS